MIFEPSIETARPRNRAGVGGRLMIIMTDAIQKFSEWRRMKVKINTVVQYQNELRRLCLFLKNPDIETITLGQVMEFLSLMKDMGYAQNTLIPVTMAFRKFFEFWRLQGFKVLDEELIPIARKEYNVPRVANEENYNQLMAAVPKETNDPRHIRNRAIVGLLWDTGSRNGEICALNTDQLDLVGRKALIKTEKSRGRRPVREMFWSEETNDALIAWMAKREHLLKKIVAKEPEAVFICINSWNSGDRFTIRGVGEMLRHYCNKAKLPYMNAHSFRHHKAHAILHRGGNQADVQNVLGHASLASSSIYTMMFGTELEGRARQFLDQPAVPEQVVIREMMGSIPKARVRQRMPTAPLRPFAHRVDHKRSRAKAYTTRVRFSAPM